MVSKTTSAPRRIEEGHGPGRGRGTNEFEASQPGGFQNNAQETPPGGGSPGGLLTGTAAGMRIKSPARSEVLRSGAR
jgi:hypothetical protein